MFVHTAKGSGGTPRRQTTEEAALSLMTGWAIEAGLVTPEMSKALQYSSDQEAVAPMEGKTNREAVKKGKHC